MAGDRRIERLSSSVATAAVLVALPGMLPTGAQPRPDLLETAISVGQRDVQAGRSLRVTDAVRNRGRATAARFTTGYYLSRDRARGRGDLRVGGRSIGRLRPGATDRGSATARISASAIPGSYPLIACADDHDRIRESDELNNCRATKRIIRVTKPSSADRTPPSFSGLERAVTCIPGPLGGDRKSSYHLSWGPATDDVTPASEIVYDIYQAITPGAEDFSKPTYTAPAGATSFSTPLLPVTKTYYFVVHARDVAGNRDRNRVERTGMNLCV
jgi:hypothetical protein